MTDREVRDQPASSQSAEAPAAAGPGGRLRAARRAMNVEVREVADALNLPPASIEAIERNDFAELPNIVFARGYVRAYAKLVELDPEPVVAAFQSAAKPTSEPQPTVAVSSIPESQGLGPRLAQWRNAAERYVRSNPQMFLGLLGLGTIALILLLWLLFSGPDDSTGSAVPPTAAPAAGLRGAAPSAPGLPPAVTAQPATSQDTPSQNAPAAASSAQPAQSADSPGSVPEVPVTAAGTPVASAAPPETAASVTAGAEALADEQIAISDGDDRLRFSFVADCWVEVRNASGGLLYGDLGKAGALLDLTGSGPFRILLGYAPGVSLAYNGETVPLAPHTRNDVARLVLGQ